MTDVLVAVAAAAAALGMFQFGRWDGRRSERERTTQARLKLEQAANTRIIDAFRRADRYRLAWLSARRRAHRGRLLAQLLREDERCES